VCPSPLPQVPRISQYSSVIANIRGRGNLVPNPYLLLAKDPLGFSASSSIYPAQLLIMATLECKIHFIPFYFCKKTNTLVLPFPLVEKKNLPKKRFSQLRARRFSGLVPRPEITTGLEDFKESLFFFFFSLFLPNPSPEDSQDFPDCTDRATGQRRCQVRWALRCPLRFSPPPARGSRTGAAPSSPPAPDKLRPCPFAFGRSSGTWLCSEHSAEVTTREKS